MVSAFACAAVKASHQSDMTPSSLLESIQDLLLVVALCDVQILSYDLKLVIGIQWINRMRKCRGMKTYKIYVLVPGLGAF
jgi:hypothetical protein